VPATLSTSISFGNLCSAEVIDDVGFGLGGFKGMDGNNNPTGSTLGQDSEGVRVCLRPKTYAFDFLIKDAVHLTSEITNGRIVEGVTPRALTDSLSMACIRTGMGVGYINTLRAGGYVIPLRGGVALQVSCKGEGKGYYVPKFMTDRLCKKLLKYHLREDVAVAGAIPQHERIATLVPLNAVNTTSPSDRHKAIYRFKAALDGIDTTGYPAVKRLLLDFVKFLIRANDEDIMTTAASYYESSGLDEGFGHDHANYRPNGAGRGPFLKRRRLT